MSEAEDVKWLVLTRKREGQAREYIGLDQASGGYPYACEQMGAAKFWRTQDEIDHYLRHDISRYVGEGWETREAIVGPDGDYDYHAFEEAYDLFFDAWLDHKDPDGPTSTDFRLWMEDAFKKYEKERGNG